MNSLALHILLLPGLLAQEYNIGFMLNEKDASYMPVYESIIEYAIDTFNSNSSGMQLRHVIQQYNGSSMYNVVNASCSLLTKDIVMVISPDHSDNIAIQADIFNRVDMPVIASGATDNYLTTGARNELFLMPPSDAIQAQVIVDLLTEYGWTKLSIIASDSNYGIHGVTTLQQLLSETTAKVTVQEEFDISVYFFNAVDDPEQLDLKDILKNVVDSLERVFVLHCEDYYGKWVLERADKAGLLRENFAWIVTESIVTSPQTLLVNKSSDNSSTFYPSYYEGLIGISLYIDTQSDSYRTFKDDALASLDSRVTGKDISPVVAMLFDAVLIAGKALKDHSEDLTNNPLSPNSRCQGSPWSDGKRIVKYLFSSEYKGATGSYRFRKDQATETNIRYRIVNFIDPGTGSESGFNGIGIWSTENGLQITTTNVQYLGGTTIPPRGVANTLEGQHLKIGATHAPPFAFHEKGCSNDDCWTGICPQIVKRLADDLNFTYDYIKSKDGIYGHLDEETGLWSGMVGDLLSNRIDIIAMDLSVSSQRRSYIDFTFSYIDSGISVIIRGESKTNNKFFFLSPFGISTWTGILIAFIIISIFQNIVGRLSPFDQHGMMAYAIETCSCPKCKDRRCHGTEANLSTDICLVPKSEAELNKDSMSLNNALWVVGGGFVGQGGEPLPRSPSGRVILLTWWFFVMLIISMYGANLTAFMTLDKAGIPIKKASDLLTQEQYSWGAQHMSVTAVLLENHVDENYRMLINQSRNIESFEKGMREVDHGGYALIEDTLWLEYNISDRCNIFFVQKNLLSIPVAFGLPINSPYARLFNKQILLYREEGYFKELWNVNGLRINNRKCAKDNVGNDKTLNFNTLIGIFYFLVLGLIISASFLLLELVVATIQDKSPNNKATFCSRLKKRLNLAFVSATFPWKRRRHRRKQKLRNFDTNDDGTVTDSYPETQIMNCYV